MSQVDTHSKPSKKTAKNLKKFHKQHYHLQTPPIQIIVKKPNAPETLVFAAVQQELDQIAHEIVDVKIKKRNTLMLAKMAKDSLLRPSECSDEKGSTQESNKYQLNQQPLLSKTAHEINDFYCAQLSKDLITSCTYFLKERKVSAKVIVNVMIVNRPKAGFNMGTLCYWDTNKDGVINIKKKMGTFDGKGSEGKQGSSNYSQSHVSGGSDSSLGSQDDLLVVTIYLCKYEEKFKSKLERENEEE